MKNAPHLLLVDDRPEDLRLLMHGLQSGDYRISVAMNGEEAVRRALLQQPDLIIMDISMPRLDGFLALQALRAHAATADVPVIFLSANEALPNKLKGFAGGAVDYIIKPYDPQEVLARIAVHLARSARPNPATAEHAAEPCDSQDGAVARVVAQYLRTHYADKSAQKMLQTMLGLSEKRLNTVFQREFGQSLAAFASAAKLDGACKLLAETELPISDIAEKSGYSSAANFTTSFGHRMGETPAAYRRRLEGEKSKINVQNTKYVDQ